jgi:hypothetical protein
VKNSIPELLQKTIEFILFSSSNDVCHKSRLDAGGRLTVIEKCSFGSSIFANHAHCNSYFRSRKQSIMIGEKVSSYLEAYSKENVCFRGSPIFVLLVHLVNDGRIVFLKYYAK